MNYLNEFDYNPESMKSAFDADLEYLTDFFTTPIFADEATRLYFLIDNYERIQKCATALHTEAKNSPHLCSIGSLDFLTALVHILKYLNKAVIKGDTQFKRNLMRQDLCQLFNTHDTHGFLPPSVEVLIKWLYPDTT